MSASAPPGFDLRKTWQEYFPHVGKHVADPDDMVKGLSGAARWKTMRSRAAKWIDGVPHLCSSDPHRQDFSAASQPLLVPTLHYSRVARRLRLPERLS